MKFESKKSLVGFSIVRVAAGLYIALYPIKSWVGLFRGTVEVSAFSVMYLVATLVVGIWIAALGVRGLRNLRKDV
ncbi:hypothetical protein A5766_00135 [Gordonia sp. 852002-51296_SCH5728562-b]|nr:hypothetical protein A5766_00135 [Gordonia sp. 852002-51296_SCH5728562-b]